MLLLGAVNWLHYMFMIPLTLLSVFLILVILVQRGRGGGLTGALGGMGGQSAFGTKAGDLFTRITIIVAAIWVLLSMASLKVLNQYAATGSLNPNVRGQPTAPGELLPSATPSTKAGTTKSGTTSSAEQPPSSTPPPPPGPPTTTTPASPPATGDAAPKSADAAQP